jgi:uncharacterized lipoprotein YajG
MVPMYSARKSTSDRFWRLAPLVLLIACISGCLLAPLSTPITYTPASIATPVPGASSVHVHVVGEDQRTDKNSVGQYGQQTVATTTNVGDTARDAIRTELQARGFLVSSEPGPGIVEVRVQVLRMNGHFFSTLVYASYTAEMTMHVEVERQGKGIVYSQSFEVTDTYRPSDFGSVSDHFGLALSGALQQGVAKLFDDPAFIAALLSKSPPPKS